MNDKDFMAFSQNLLFSRLQVDCGIGSKRLRCVATTRILTCLNLASVFSSLRLGSSLTLLNGSYGESRLLDLNSNSKVKESRTQDPDLPLPSRLCLSEFSQDSMAKTWEPLRPRSSCLCSATRTILAGSGREASCSGPPLVGGQCH